MTISVTATQRSNSAVELNWASTDPAPVAGFIITSELNPPGTPKQVAVVTGSASIFLDDIGDIGVVTGDVIRYVVQDGDTLTSGTAPDLTVADLDVPFTYGPVDPLAPAFRYTTLLAVKQRLGIEHDQYDDGLTTANQAAETAIDQTLQRSLPDQGVNPEISGVPAAISNWALDATISLWKAADAPFGQAGAEQWLGSLDILGETERVMRRHPGAYGYKVAWGIGAKP